MVAVFIIESMAFEFNWYLLRDSFYVSKHRTTRKRKAKIRGISSAALIIARPSEVQKNVFLYISYFLFILYDLFHWKKPPLSPFTMALNTVPVVASAPPERRKREAW